MPSGIEWTEDTWNPVTGCKKVSPGCANCYAEVIARRFADIFPRGFDVHLRPERLDIPRRRRKPTMWFVNSMSDLFHPKVPDDYINRVVETMRDTPRHTYQILTKRSGRMRGYFDALLGAYAELPNVWLGVSAENRKHGFPRIRDLRDMRYRAPVRFLSVEPLLEDLGELDLTGIDWVIVGGESGHRARPMRKFWVENIRLQCEMAGVKFFFKQWGMFDEDGKRRRGKKESGRLLGGVEYNEFPVMWAKR